MDIKHRITFRGSSQTELDRLGAIYKVSPLPNDKIGLLHVDIEESQPSWNTIKNLAQECGAVDVYDTVFTHTEIMSAQWCRLIPIFEHGYPQPERTWVTNPINYEGHCPQCGTHGRQIRPFRIKQEPRLGKNDFMSLYWVHELFARQGIMAMFTQNHMLGCEVHEVILHKTEVPSNTIVQIYVSQETEASFLPGKTDLGKTCSVCGALKYLPHMRGYMTFDTKLLNSNVDFMWTHEWFGDGHMAYRELLVSNKIAQLVFDNKWQGIRLKPVETST